MEKIKQLEQLVDLTLLLLNNLHSEKIHLEQRVRELEKEQESSFKEHENSKKSQEMIKNLEFSKRKLEKEHSAVRVKVKKALQKLEKMEFLDFYRHICSINFQHQGFLNFYFLLIPILLNVELYNYL